jgi:hypothetical protein
VGFEKLMLKKVRKMIGSNERAAEIDFKISVLH